LRKLTGALKAIAPVPEMTGDAVLRPFQPAYAESAPVPEFVMAAPTFICRCASSVSPKLLAQDTGLTTLISPLLAPPGVSAGFAVATVTLLPASAVVSLEVVKSDSRTGAANRSGSETSASMVVSTPIMPAKVAAA